MGEGRAGLFTGEGEVACRGQTGVSHVMGCRGMDYWQGRKGGEDGKERRGTSGRHGEGQGPGGRVPHVALIA